MSEETQRTLNMLRGEWTKPYRESLLELVNAVSQATVDESKEAQTRLNEAMDAAQELLIEGPKP